MAWKFSHGQQWPRNPTMRCVCGHGIDDHDADDGWLCLIWDETEEAWCPCLLYVARLEQPTGTNSLTITA